MHGEGLHFDDGLSPDANGGSAVDWTSKGEASGFAGLIHRFVRDEFYGEVAGIEAWSVLFFVRRLRSGDECWGACFVDGEGELCRDIAL